MMLLINYIISLFKEYVKYIFKTTTAILGFLISRLFYIKQSQKNVKNKILIIFGGGIGDVVKMSVICNFLDEYLSKNFDIYYLLPYKLNFPYAKEIFYFEYKKAKIDLFYLLKIINNFKKIKFNIIITLLPSWENFLWILGLSLDAKKLYVPLESSPYFLYKVLNKIINLLLLMPIKKRIKFIKSPSIFDKEWPNNIFPSSVYKHSYFISQIIKDILQNVKVNELNLVSIQNLMTQIVINNKFEEKYWDIINKDFGLEKYSYCIVGLGSSSYLKNFSTKKFAEVCKYLFNKGYKIVLVGDKKDQIYTEEFKKIFDRDFIDLISKTSLEELCILIKNSILVLANDTSFIHIGIALKKPTVCPILNTSIGVDSLYGYRPFNKWVYIDKKPSLNSINEITTEMVINAIESIEFNLQKEYKFELFFKII